MKIDQTLPDSYMQRAIAHTMQKRGDKALEELNKAVAVWGAFPRNVRAAGGSAGAPVWFGNASMTTDRARSTSPS